MVFNVLLNSHAFEILQWVLWFGYYKASKSDDARKKGVFCNYFEILLKKSGFFANINLSHIYCRPFGGDVFLNNVLITKLYGDLWTGFEVL